MRREITVDREIHAACWCSPSACSQPVGRGLGRDKRCSTAALLVALILSGCSEPFGCTTSIEPAVEVAVVDSITGEPAADGAFGVIRDGSYVDSPRPTASDSDGHLIMLSAGDERQGT